MRFTKIIFSFLTVAVCASCSKIDNYVAPDGGIHGVLTDNLTGENFQTEQPNGFTVKLFEKGGKGNSPIAFQGKPDGTFENAFIFKNDYKLLVTEGAFFPLDTVNVSVDANSESNFKVTPFLAIVNPAVKAEAGKVVVTYQLKREIAADKIIERKVLVSRVPTVNNSIFDFKSQADLTAVTDVVILASDYSDTVSGLTSGQTYYVRVAARTNNALKKYNYSKVFAVKIP